MHKISIDHEVVMRKYRLQSRNYYVSSTNDMFNCGAVAVVVDFRIGTAKEQNIGISKQEIKISNSSLVHLYSGNINGGS